MFFTANLDLMPPFSMKWPSMRVAVVGTGRSGIAAAKLLHTLGAQVQILEKTIENVPKFFTEWLRQNNCEILFGDHNVHQFENVDLLIPSPGIPISYLQQFIPKEANIHIMSETEFAWYQLTDEKVLAVTGTSGKTTITSICSAMLKEQGINIFVGGNIGTPLSEYILNKKKAEIVLLELSSFQLQTCSLFRPNIAIFANIYPNHLDYHKDMDEYLSAKIQLCKNQNKNDLAILKSDMCEFVDHYNLKARIVFYSDRGRFPLNHLLGTHNRENFEAAWLACKELGVTENVAKHVAATFKPLEHRLELVKCLHGIQYVNDSKGTTVDALRVALESFEQPILLLAGGKFKGGDLTMLRPLIKERVRAVGLFGNSRGLFEGAWGDLVAITWDNSLEGAVIRLSSLAQEGEVILLAPATASFDQYMNYIERGKDFKRIVNEVLI